jgi:hypothetical protein
MTWLDAYSIISISLTRWCERVQSSPVSCRVIACKLLVSLSDPPRGNEYPVDRRGFRGGALRDATLIMAGMEELEIHSKVLLTFPVTLG